MKLPSPFWKGARFGLLVFLAFLSSYGFYHFRTGLPQALMGFAGIVLGIVLFYLLEWIWKYAKTGLDSLPKDVFGFIAAILTGSVLLHAIVIRLPDQPFYMTILIGMIAQILLFGGIYALFRKGKFTRFYIIALILGFALIFLGGYYWLNEGGDPYDVMKPYPDTAGFSPALTDPGLPGTHAFFHFSYGSQNSKRRSVYSEDVRIVTPTVDGSLILPEWKGEKAKWRKRYWGFGIDSLPLNGLVWMPKGEGPFPVIFVLHGNHGMEDFSDPGYTYLGEHLASQGYITVSVDENFLNATWSGDFRGKEMPARAWLLLKHLELWRKWNNEDDPVKGKVDMDRILLIGHSRGGEAVAIAAAYNHLDRFPDNAFVPFEFKFGIEGLVTIAPTDKRYFRRMELTNIDYLTIQGSYDSDEASLFGKRIGDRITYTDSADHVNASVLVHGANHGQFNTGWGKRDFGKPFGLLLNTKALIKKEEQLQVAKVLISTFAEGVLKGRQEYNQAFRDFRQLDSYLPEGVYLSTFRDGREKILAEFDKDLYVDRLDHIQGSIEANGLKVWRNEKLRYRDSDFQGNNAMVIGWNHQDTTIENADHPFFRFRMVPDTNSNHSFSYLRFDLAPGNEGEILIRDEKKENKKEKRELEWRDIDFTIRCADGYGTEYKLRLSDVAAMPPKLKVRFLKSARLTKEVIGDEWEAAFQSFYIPFNAFDPPISESRSVNRISFDFDASREGIILLDRVGFAN